MKLGHSLAVLHLSGNAFLALAALGLFLAVTIEQAQLLAKFLGARRARVAGGYNTAMKIMVVNRLGTVLFFLFIALAVDLGAQPAVIARFFAAAALAIALGNIAVVGWLWRRSHIAGLADVLSDVPLVPVGGALVAGLFGLLGLTLPMLLSASNPALRLTLANTGFILNSVFTIITVFLVENHVAALIDRGDHGLGRFVVQVYVMRTLSALLAAALLVFLGRSDLSFGLNY